MHELTYTNGTITPHGVEYSYEQVEKIDDMFVHIFMGGQIIGFVGGETSVNGAVMQTADGIINALNNN